MNILTLLGFNKGAPSASEEKSKKGHDAKTVSSDRTVSGDDEQQVTSGQVAAERLSAIINPQRSSGAPSGTKSSSRSSVAVIAPQRLIERSGAIMDFMLACQANDAGATSAAWENIKRTIKLNPGFRAEPPLERLLGAALYAGIEHSPSAVRSLLLLLHREMLSVAIDLSEKNQRPQNTGETQTDKIAADHREVVQALAGAEMLAPSTNNGVSAQSSIQQSHESVAKPESNNMHHVDEVAPEDSSSVDLPAEAKVTPLSGQDLIADMFNSSVDDRFLSVASSNHPAGIHDSVVTAAAAMIAESVQNQPQEDIFKPDPRGIFSALDYDLPELSEQSALPSRAVDPFHDLPALDALVAESARQAQQPLQTVKVKSGDSD